MTQPQPAMRALKMTYDEARGGREAALALAPLLTLLDPLAEGEGSPLDQVTDLLATIVLTQEKILSAIEALATRLDAGRQR